MAKTKGPSARERMQKHRDKIKSDPLLYEESKRKERERYKKRVKEGKIKKATSQMSYRERRNLRKVWREKTRNYRASKKTTESKQAHNTPPPSPPSDHQNQNIMQEQDETVDRRKVNGKKRRRKHREELRSQIKNLKQKLKNMERIISKYKQRNSRSLRKSTNGSPGKLVKHMLLKQKVSPVIKRRLLFSSVMEKQISDSFKKEISSKKKREFAQKMAGAIVKKYRFLNSISKLTSKKMLSNTKQISSEAKTQRNHLRLTVKEFYLRDENSRTTAGKKETITRGKTKKQRRYMNASMKALHAKFLKEFPSLKISYSFFCLYRPFWVLQPSAKDRDTCLCKVHENFDILIKKLKYRNVIHENSPEKVVEAMTCKSEDRTINCLERKCANCKEKKIAFYDLDLTDITVLKKWVTETQTILIKGKEKTIKKTVKSQVECTNQDLTKEFDETIYKYLQHIANIKHQYKTLDEIKRKLKMQDILIHMDFSENYSCKYASEVQSSHFGGSKGQISIHTVVVYFHSKESNSIESKCFATISDNLRHDTSAIFAHLEPVVQDIKMSVGDFKSIHLLSDGPTTQYRNRTMFYLIGNYAPILFGDTCEEIHWHYSEAGHGKGAPDGVGGCLKRTADRLVGEGKDIMNSEDMLNLVTTEVKSVKLIKVNENRMKHIDQFLPDQKVIRAFKGTMQTHEVIWLKNQKELRLNRLSCTVCKPSQKCSHFSLGTLLLTPKPIPQPKDKTPVAKSKLRVEDVYSDSDDESDNQQSHRSKEDISPNDFVVVEIKGKKTVQQFIALIKNIDFEREEASVSFLKHSVGDKFIFPVVEDGSEVDLKDIVQVLNPPLINKRGHHFFKNVKLDFPKLQ